MLIKYKYNLMKKTKQTVKKKEVEQTSVEMIKDELKQAYGKLTETVDWAQKKYDKLDSKKKNQITAGLLGAAALIAGAIGAKKMMKKKNKNNPHGRTKSRQY